MVSGLESICRWNREEPPDSRLLVAGRGGSVRKPYGVDAIRVADIFSREIDFNFHPGTFSCCPDDTWCAPQERIVRPGRRAKGERGWIGCHVISSLVWAATER